MMDIPTPPLGRTVTFCVGKEKIEITPTLRLIEQFEQEFGSACRAFRHFTSGDVAVFEMKNMAQFLIQNADQKRISNQDIDHEILTHGGAVFFEPLSLFLALAVAGEEGMAVLASRLSASVPVSFSQNVKSGEV